jgi:hypothetical protein
MPANSTTVPRPDLAVVGYEYMAQGPQRGFIGRQVLPIFEVARETAQYPVIPVEALLSMPETARAPKSGYARDDYKYDWLTYHCKENGFEEPVDDKEAATLGYYFDAESVATIRCMNIIERVQEKRIADKVFNESTFTPHSLTYKWDSDSSDPLKDVNAGKAAVEDDTGLTVNSIIFNRAVFRTLGVNKAVLDRIKFTNPAVQAGEIPAKLLAQYFGVDQLLVAGGVYNSAGNNLDAVISKIWSSSYAMLGVVSTGGQDLKEPSLGRTFMWTEDSPQPVVVESYREDQTRSNVIRARQNTDECITMAAAGYLLKGVL